jgi:methionyl-tRNA formyltransferase
MVNFIFFGTGPVAREVLEELAARGFVPSLIVTAPDSAKGRGLEVSPSPAGAWAESHGIEADKPEDIDELFLAALRERTAKLDVDVYIVADYGAILPKALLDIPEKGALNVHPSLLPRLRGPSPIRSAILTDERETGVTIMLLDEKMDHGPILAQRKVAVPEWPPRASALEALLAREGGALLAEILPLWMRGEIEPHPQNDDIATYCRKFKKEDGLLDLPTGRQASPGEAYANLLKIRALEGWPGTYGFFDAKGAQIRAKVLDAHIKNGALVIDRVIPEGRKEMPFADFARALGRPPAS